jgi:hypothetical protein
MDAAEGWEKPEFGLKLKPPFDEMTLEIGRFVSFGMRR